MPRQSKTNNKTTRRQRPETSSKTSTFRRYRTLVSPKIAAESSSRSVKRSLVVTRRRVIGLLAVFGVASVLALVMLVQFVGIVHIAADDPTVELASDYQSTVEQYYKSHPIERLRFLLDRERFGNVLISNHHEISGFTIDPVAIGEVQLSLEFRRPTASWNIDNQQQYVDQNGVIFAENYYQRPEVKIIDNSGLQGAASKNAVASQSFLSFTGQLVGLGQRYDLPVASVTIPKSAIRDVVVKFVDQPYKIRMNTGGVVGQQFEDAKRAIDWVGQHRSDTKTIDVRVERRAAYR